MLSIQKNIFLTIVALVIAIPYHVNAGKISLKMANAINNYNVRTQAAEFAAQRKALMTRAFEVLIETHRNMEPDDFSSFERNSKLYSATLKEHGINLHEIDLDITLRHVNTVLARKVLKKISAKI